MPDSHESKLEVGVLGLSAVGKSTLINALLSERLSILPQGGVGPLTGCPILVSYSAEPSFRARYVNPDWVRRLLQDLNEELRTRARSARGLTPDHASLRKARLLVTGNQFGTDPPAYVKRGLEAVFDASRLSLLGAADRLRVQQVAACLSSTGPATVSVNAGQHLPAFLASLKEHVTGHLSPITREAHVGWDSAVLRSGVCFVDLPGVGVANDAYAQETVAWLSGAKAVLLVVGRSGIPEAAVSLLFDAGYVSRLLGGDGSQLLIAVTNLDSSATDSRKNERLTQRGRPLRSWSEHFEEQCAASIMMIRNQLRYALPPDANGAAVEHFLAAVSIHPLSAPEYQRAFRNDADDPGLVRDPEITGIPSLIRRLAGLQSAAKHPRRSK